MFNVTEHYNFDDFVVGTAVVCVDQDGQKIVGVVVNKTDGNNYYPNRFEVFWEGCTFPSEYFDKEYYSFCKLKDWKKFKKHLRGNRK